MAANSKRMILLLDDDRDLRAVLVAALVHYHIGEPVAYASVAEMIEHGDQALDCSLALLDVNLGSGKPSGVDAYVWLTQHGYRGQVAFLTGHASQHPIVVEAEKNGTVLVLKKPIGLNVIRDLSEGAHA